MSLFNTHMHSVIPFIQKAGNEMQYFSSKDILLNVYVL
jgi:hypothetical protein